jgi:uncharacterized protein YjdB/endo-1,4-beta-D-glucanase Y
MNIFYTIFFLHVGFIFRYLSSLSNSNFILNFKLHFMKKFLHLILLFVGLFVVNGLFAQINTPTTYKLGFGKNTAYKNGIMPTNLPTGGTYGTSQAAADAYNTWKSTYVVTSGSSSRVLFDDGSSTVSEGIGYGMLLSVYAADKTLFDGLWTYYKAHLDGNGFMNWKYDSGGNVTGSGGATDADVDVAMSLVIAAEQWSAVTGNTYSADAKALITKIKNYELGSDGSTLNGDTWGNTNSCRNPSYFAPGYYTQFAKVDATNATFWGTTAITATNTLLNANRNTTSGLVSNWCDNAGTENSCGNTGSGATGYGADACRNPWRMAVDYLWNGSSASAAATSINSKLTAFVNGYENQLKGPQTNRAVSNPSGGSYINGSYATFALAPMTATTAQASLNKCYTAVANLSGNDAYFNATMRCISLFTLTGNFWAPGASGFVFPPTIASAVTDGTGKIITLTANKTLTTSTPANSAFTVYFNGVAQTTSTVSVSGSSITVTVPTAPAPGQTVTISYSGTTITSTDAAVLATFTGLTVLNMLAGNETILDDCDDGNDVNNLGGIWFTFNDTPDQTKACTKGTTSSITPLSSAKNPLKMTAPGYNSSAFALNASYTLGSNYTPYASGTSGACAGWTNPAYVGIGTWCNHVQSVSMDWRSGTGVSFWYKGPAVAFQIIISEVTDFCFHQVTVPAATSWTKVTVLWTDLAQPTWGKAVTFSAQHVQKLQWQYATGTSGAAASTGVIWIDDVHIMNMPPVAMTSFTIGIDPLSKITNPLTLTTTSTDTLKLQVVPTPTTGSYPVASWKSSDTTVVKVDYNGNIKVIGYGTATITAIGKMQQGLSATYTVTVPQPAVNPTAITFTPSTYSIGIGSTATLNPTFAPTGVNQTGLTWLSSNTAIATVSSSGIVTGVAAGSVTITATSTAVTTVKGTATVTVTKIAVTGISITPTPLTVVVGTPATLTAVIAPTNASVQTVTWKSSNSTVATVSGGVVTGVGAGTCNITGTSSDNTTILQVVPCTVTVPTILPTAVAVALSPTSIVVGATSKATSTITPTNATDTSVTWASSNTAVATVTSGGIVTAVAVGTASITATSVAANTITGSATITVTAVLPTAIAVTLTPASIAIGATSTGSVVVTPSNATVQTVTWTSSNTAIATVNATTGVVTAVATGTATITATSVSAPTVKGTATITVAAILPTAIAVTLTPATLAIAGTSTGSVVVTPSNATVQTVTWSSSNTAIATVNATTGVVTAVAAGTATITATSTSATTIAGTAIITVSPMLPTAIAVTLAPTSITIAATSAGSVVVSPSNTTNPSVTWSSSNTAIATVDPTTGIITGVAVGTASIVATSVASTSIKGSATITVTAILPTSIAVTPATTNTLLVNGTVQLSAAITPSNATVQTVTWTSSNTAIATVDINSGLVTAVAIGGPVAITATSTSAPTIKGTASITVIKTAVTGITVTPTPLSIILGNQGTLTAVIAPTTATIKTVNWVSSNNAIATVTSGGIVTSVAVGTCTVTATSSDNTAISQIIPVTITPVLPTSITVTPATTPSLYVGGTVTLKAAVAPSTTTDNSVTWTSSNTTIASVDANTGIVTGNTIGGPVTITATSVALGTITGTATVTVVKTPVTGITITPATLGVVIGTPGNLTAVIAPTTATIKTVNWISSNTAIATVTSGGIVSGVTAGTCTITGTSADNTAISQNVAVTVTAAIVLPTSLTVTPASSSIYVAGTTTLTSTILPTDASNMSVTWSSSNPAVATVNATTGLITGVTLGSTTITATSVSATTIKNTAIINVVKTPVTGISITPTTLAVIPGTPETLTAVISPSTATIQTVTWLSSNTAIATVTSGGVVSGIAAGTCTITGTSTDNSAISQIIPVTVTTAIVLPTSIAVTPATNTLFVSGTVALKSTVSPTNTTDTTVSWASSNIAIATVNASGVVTGVAIGSVTITATSIASGTITGSAIVTVVKTPVSSISVTPTSVLIEVSKTATATVSIIPVDATNQTVIWVSANPTIASVTSGGIITAVSSGSTTITVTSNDNTTLSKIVLVNCVSKIALAAAITNATTLNTNATEGVSTGMYPVGSKTTLQNAINAATIVNANATATQTEVDAALVALNTAVLAFQNSIITVDLSALTSAITSAQSVYSLANEGSANGQYPTGSKAILQTAIDAATAVKLNTLSSQAQVDQAIKDLNTAVASFQAKVIGVNKGALVTAINSAQTVYSTSTEGTGNGQYPTGSKATLQTAIDAASAVNTNSLASQAEVDQAIIDLQTAVTTFQNLKITVNKSVLIAEISTAQGIYTNAIEGTTTGQYPVGSKAILQAAIDVASAVNISTSASQAQVDQAVVDLQTAVTAFQGKVIGVDKTKLVTAIGSAQTVYNAASEGVYDGKYPIGSKAILKSAIDAASAVNTNTTATQADVNAAIITLNAALAKFQASKIVIDRSVINTTISSAQTIYTAAIEGLGNGQYPVGSKDVLNLAIITASDIRDDAGSSQPTIDQAVIDLQAAIAAFQAQIITVTKTALVAEINTVQAVYTPAVEGTADGQYTVGSKATLLITITDANTINADPNASQAQVDQALLDLQTALATFQAAKIIIDKSALATAISSAQTTYTAAVEGTIEGQYPVGSKAILQTAITAATTVNANKLATQAQVDQAKTDLLAALAAFKLKVIPPAVISTLIFDAEKDNLTLFNTPWFSYNDSKAKPAPGGTSRVTPLSTDTIPFTMTAPGVNSSAHAAMMDYSLMGHAVLGFDPFVGMGFGFTNPLSAYDLSGTTGISFWVKSNKDYFVEINLTSITDDCNYFKKLAATATWTEVTLTWAELSQYNWGIQKPWDLKLLNQIQWKIQDADGTAGQVWIDDVRILGKKLNMPVIADKTALVAMIKTAQTVYTGAIEGSAEGQYPTGSKAILQTAITAATTVNTTMTITQAEVDQAVIDLQTAITQFQAKTIHVNKAALVTAIASAQAVHDGAIEGSANGQYPTGSKATLQIAINTATNVNTNNLVTQAQVDAAIVTLQSAVTAFKAKVIVINKTALLALISSAQTTANAAVVGTLDGQYPQSAKTDLQTAITVAQTASTNASISQAQIDQAVIDLQTAIDIFKAQVNSSLPVDKAALNTKITSANSTISAAVEGTTTGKYPVGSKAILQTAITTAQAVYTNTTATQAQVNVATINLQTAISQFLAKVITVDKTGLTQTITDAQTILIAAKPGSKPGQYPTYAIDALTNAITAAQAVNSSTTSTQTEIDAAQTALATAITEFELKVVGNPNKVTLNTDIQNAQSILSTAVSGTKPTQYPTADYNAFVTAINQALAVYTDPTMSQAEVNIADANINTAMSKFLASQYPLPDKSVLNNKILDARSLYMNAIEGTLPTQYTKATRAIFYAAIVKADSIKNSSIATQSEVDNEITVLDQAITAFKASVNPGANKTALTTAITDAKSKLVGIRVPKDYPQAAVDSLYNELSIATGVKDNSEATQAEVNQAVIDLQTAIAQFQAQSTHVVNKAALVAAIASAQSAQDAAIEGSAIGQYPTGSKATLQIAINAATTVNTNTLATQAEVDAEIVKLNQATSLFLSLYNVGFEDIMITTTIGPNPVVNMVTIKSTETITSTDIYSITGIIVKQLRSNSTSIEIDLSDIIAGNYFIKIILSDGSTLLKEISKE